MVMGTGAVTPAAACVSLDGRAQTAQNLNALMTARIRAIVCMASVTALTVLVVMTVVLSSAYWIAVTTATVLMDPAYVRWVSLVRTAARPTASTTAWVVDVVLKMSVFATSHGKALTALNSSVQRTVMIVDTVLMAPVNVKRATLEKIVVSLLVLATVITMACVSVACVCVRTATVERIAQNSHVPITAMKEAIASTENVSVTQDLKV